MKFVKTKKTWTTYTTNGKVVQEIRIDYIDEKDKVVGQEFKYIDWDEGDLEW